MPDVYAIATESPAAGFRGAVPDGANDYVAAVRPQGDVWSGVQFPAVRADAVPGRADARPRSARLPRSALPSWV